MAGELTFLDPAGLEDFALFVESDAGGACVVLAGDEIGVGGVEIGFEGSDFGVEVG